MKILLTAFDPFGGESINPAQEAVRLVPDSVSGAQIIKLEIPTVFYKSIDAVISKARDERPDAIVCVGQAGGRYEITPERVAINVNDARIPDNEGNQPLEGNIYEDGPAAYFSTLPVKAMVKAIRDAGLPSSLSNTAGTFVCNHVMYGVLHHIAREMPGVRGGFIHVPYTPSQAAHKSPPVPCLSQQDIARGLEAALAAVVLNDKDITAAGGKEH